MIFPNTAACTAKPWNNPCAKEQPMSHKVWTSREKQNTQWTVKMQSGKDEWSEQEFIITYITNKCKEGNVAVMEW